MFWNAHRWDESMSKVACLLSTNKGSMCTALTQALCNVTTKPCHSPPQGFFRLPQNVLCVLPLFLMAWDGYVLSNSLSQKKKKSRTVQVNAGFKHSGSLCSSSYLYCDCEFPCIDVLGIRLTCVGKEQSRQEQTPLVIKWKISPRLQSWLGKGLIEGSRGVNCLLQPNSCRLWAELRHLLLEKGNFQIWRCRVIADKGRPWPASKTWYLGRKVYHCLLLVIYMCLLVEHIAATPAQDLFPSSFLGGTLTWVWLF